MRKTQHTILLSHTPITSKEEFWERLFWKHFERSRKDKTETIYLAIPGRAIYEMILNGQFYESDRESVMQKLGISQNQYYHILAVLRSLGLIRKDPDGYKTSSDFIKRLERMIEYVTAYMEGEKNDKKRKN